jgi:hypothetical protein
MALDNPEARIRRSTAVAQPLHSHTVSPTRHPGIPCLLIAPIMWSGTLQTTAWIRAQSSSPETPPPPVAPQRNVNLISSRYLVNTWQNPLYI